MYAGRAFKRRRRRRFRLNHQIEKWARVILVLMIIAMVTGVSRYIDFQKIAAVLLLVLCAWLLQKCLRRLRRRARDKRLQGSTAREVDRMDGVEFEEYLAAQFRAMGYQVKLTPASGDYGADLVLKKGAARTVVQAKRYKGNVGPEAVQQVVAAKAMYKAKEAIVVTNSFFTENAHRLAKVNNVRLWDRGNLERVFGWK